MRPVGGLITAHEIAVFLLALPLLVSKVCNVVASACTIKCVCLSQTVHGLLHVIKGAIPPNWP